MMGPFALGATEGLAGTAFVVALAGGFVPIASMELYLVSVSALAGPSHLVPVVTAATLGQMLSKVVFYLAARGVIRVPMKESAEKLEKWRQRFESHPLGEDALLFLSASVGFPPYYFTPFVAGALRLNFWRFLITGLAGRALRFGVIYAFPEVVRGLR